MKYIIIGDSWGMGEFVSKGLWIEPVPDTGIEHYLREAGHNVDNYAVGSAGNFGQLRNLYWKLKDNCNYDFVVWFHTEPLRDIQQIIIDEPSEGQLYFPDFNINSWKDSLHYITQVNYDYAQKIYKEFNIPFIVIGGQSPVDPIINNYKFAYIRIDNWLAQLLNIDFKVFPSTIGSWHKIEKILKHYGVDLKKFIVENTDELETIIRIENLAKDSELFPDNAHPGRECFKKLAQKLL